VVGGNNLRIEDAVKHPGTSILQGQHSSLDERETDKGEGRCRGEVLADISRESLLGSPRIFVLAEHSAEAPTLNLLQRNVFVQLILVVWNVVPSSRSRVEQGERSWVDGEDL